MDAIEIDQVTKTFGQVTAVDNLTLSVPERSVYGFIGPNGSGKTTTLRMIMGILYPDAGSIRVLGARLHGACNDRVGYMPEERGLYKKMKVREILEFYGGLKGGNDVGGEVGAWLERLGLSEWSGRKVETLSKGMSQKVQFIATVVSRPDVVILDEPFAGLDPVNTDVIRDAVLELRDRGTTVILSTHDMSTAERMCDFIFMIFKGKKVLDGTLDAIQDEYSNDTIRIRSDDGMLALGDLDGVEKVADFGQVQDLRIGRNRDPQEIVTAIMERTKVTSFQIAKPSLHDIFVRIAGPEAEEDVANA